MNMGLEINIILAYALGLILLYVIGWLLLVPLKLLMRLIINGIIGGIALIVFNFIGSLIGLHIVINPYTALITGFLGVPGIILILALGAFL